MFEELLEQIRKEISEGIMWYGRLYCPDYPEYKDSEWIRMSQFCLYDNWEYKREDSDIIYRNKNYLNY